MKVANIRGAMKDSARVLMNQIIDNLSGPARTNFPDTANPYPGRVSGDLAGSVNALFTDGGYTTMVGPDERIAPYARIHEEGGTVHQVVTPKQQRFLAAVKGIFVKVGQLLKIPIPARPYIAPALGQSFNKLRTVWEVWMWKGMR